MRICCTGQDYRDQVIAISALMPHFPPENINYDNENISLKTFECHRLLSLGFLSGYCFTSSVSLAQHKLQYMQMFSYVCVCCCIWTWTTWVLFDIFLFSSKCFLCVPYHFWCKFTLCCFLCQTKNKDCNERLLLLIYQSFFSIKQLFILDSQSLIKPPMTSSNVLFWKQITVTEN